MNVTFLSSTSTFNGLIYNYKKVEKGTAELLHTQNMVGLSHLDTPTKADYLEYLKAWSERNTRVKNPQFHVAISVRGREKNAEELLDIAREWMEKMGYKDTPALFFFHHDTENNHLHIVSSRIGADGKKINASNEIRRGVAHLRAMDRGALDKQAEQDKLDALGYLVSTRAQLTSVLSKKGYRVKVEGGDLVMYKGKERLQEIDKATLDTHLQKKVEINALRGEQIRNAIAGYRQDGVSLEAIRGMLKETMNIDLIFFGKKGAPYGWSIIDHEWRSVYKGNEILPLKDVVDESKNILSDADRLKTVLEQTISALRLNPRLNSREFKALAKPYGIYKQQGKLMYKKYPLGQLPEDLQERLRYNDRLDKAGRIIPHRRGELEAIARYFKVDASELLEVIRDRTAGEEKSTSHNLRELYEAWKGATDPQAFLKEQNLVLLNSGVEVYMLDMKYERIGLVDSRAPHASNNDYREGEHIRSSEGIEELLEELLPNHMYDNDRGSSVDNRLRNKKKKR
jgi:hypothetical protein